MYLYNMKSGMLQMQVAMSGITSPKQCDSLCEDSHLVEVNYEETSVNIAILII
jgi:hypothetical protein